MRCEEQLKANKYASPDKHKEWLVVHSDEMERYQYLGITSDSLQKILLISELGLSPLATRARGLIGLTSALSLPLLL